MSEELIYKVGVEGTNELNKLENSVDKAGKSVGKTKLYMSELRTELRKARGDMIKYAEGTEEYNRALARGSQIISKINDANSKMRIGVQDLGDTTRNVTSTMVGFAGGFQVVQSAMSLFGVENEETIKTVLKLQQTMAIVQGMATFAQGINDAQNLLAGFRASSAQMNMELNDASQSMESVKTSSDAMGESVKTTGKESAVLGSNLAGNVAIGEKLTDSIREMNDVRKNSIRIAVAELTEESKNISILKEKHTRLKEEIALALEKRKVLQASEAPDAIALEMLEEETELLRGKSDALLEEVLASQDRRKGLQEHIKSMKEANEYEDMLAKAREQNKTTTEKFTEATKKASKGMNAFAKSITKSLATMGGFLLVIWAVTSAISWLVKKLSEIPEDLKITLEIEDTAIRNLTRDIERARLFALRYNKAVSDGNKERIKQLEEIGRKDFKLNDAQLKAIGEQREAWKEAFKEYLQIAKDTYFNEALAKRKSEAEVNLQIAEQEEASYRLKIEEQDLDRFVLKVAAERISLDRKLNKSLKEQKKTKEEIAILDKIAYKDIPSPKVDAPTTDTSGGRVSAGTGTSLADRRPDAVEKDLEIKYLRERNALTKELTEEELVIYEENLRKKDVLQSDSEVKYTEYQIRLGQARATDLENQKGYIEESIEKAEQYYKEELSLNNKNLEETTIAHNEELDKLRGFNQIKFDIEERHLALAEERRGLDGEKDAERIKAIDAEMEANKRLYVQNNDNIAQSKELVAKHKQEISDIEEKLKLLDNTPEEIARLEDELQKLNLAIADNSAFLVDSLARNTQAMLEQATFYVDTMAQTFNGLESMTGDFMQAEDNKLAKEKNNLELSQAYREADSEQQQQMMYELELANYEAKKKTFETNKAFQIGGVVATSAANQMDIIKAWLDPKTGGPLSPANIAVAAAATAANIATTIGSIKQISSTSLDKPVPPMSGMGGGSPVGNIALSPHKTGLTSKEENLNMMYQSGKVGPEESIVRVSDINNVQKRVRVREKNSSY